jgi:hypothetical protein
MSKEQKIVIIAGPNGAGKTTFAREFLVREAGRPMLEEIMSSIRRRFDKGLNNFNNVYKNLVYSWVAIDRKRKNNHAAL